MITWTGEEASAWTQKTRTIVAGLLIAAMLVVASTMAAAPARASTTFVVNGTGDAKDASTASPACDTDPSTAGSQCTLRAAIEQANTTLGADTINFAIPGSGGKTIHVGATVPSNGPLPAITERVTIDGYTQTGAHPNTKTVGDDASLKVVLEGTEAGGDGLAIADASNSLIKGLVINGFSGSGINVFTNSFAPTVGTRIVGNFIGTDASGTLDKGNGSDGVDVFSPDISQTVVGGTTPAARNLISGHDRDGVSLGDTDQDLGVSPSDAVRVQGNYVGTDRSGTKDIGNDADGIFLNLVSGATIGGKTAASRNLISGNGGGVDLFLDADTKVLGNRLGTTASGTGPLGNDEYGVLIQSREGFGATNNQVGDGTAEGSNTIAFNGTDGVEIHSDQGEEVSRNSIFSNVGLGIDLLGPGETESTNVSIPNDLFDTDAGPNGLQNRPVVTSAKTGSLKTTIKGNLKSTQDRTYTVEFYANPSNTNEGKKFLGETSVRTTVDGLASFAFTPGTKVPVGQTITATATDAATHDTSEFSAPRTVASS